MMIFVKRLCQLPLYQLALILLLATLAGLPAVRGELLVSEMMYHPAAAPELDDPEAGEFLELFNAGSEPVDLSGFYFDRGIAYTFPVGTSIAANERLVLAKNTAFMAASYGINEPLGSYEGRLDNSGEQLRLKDANGNTRIDFRYGVHGDWPAAPNGTGHSLVFSQPAGDPECGRDWSASRERNGSPGRPEPSEIEPTTRRLIQKGTIGWYFKGTKEPSDGTTKWAANSFIPDHEWLQGGSGYGYSSEADELAPVSTRLPDMRGNYVALYLRLDFNLSQDELKRLASLVLTMHYDDSYVAYLNGVRVASTGVNGNPPAFDQRSIAGEDYLPDIIDLTARRDLLIAGANVLAVQGHNVGLNNSSDFVLAPELDLTLQPAQTPDETRRQIIINEIQANHSAEPDFVELYNPADEPIAIGGMWLSDDSGQLDKHSIPENTSLGAKEFLAIPVSAGTTGFALGARGDAVFLTAPDLSFVAAAYAFGPQLSDTSIGRFPASGVNWYRSAEPSPNAANNRSFAPQAVLSELMYHDPLSQGNEYIELRVLGDQPVAADRWELNGVRFQFDSETVLTPGRFYLIADGSSNIIERYNIPPEIILGNYAGSLSNGGERVSLLDADDIIVDTVRYEDDVPWPITADGLGASLERNCFAAPFDTPSAWSASPLHRPSPGSSNYFEDCQEPAASSIYISEFVYHAATRTEDDRTTEFIELTNAGAETVSLEGWALAGDIFHPFPPSTALAPSQCLLAAWSPPQLADKYSLNPATIQGPYQGELSNGGGHILLVRADGRLADHIRYDDDFPWPSLADGAAGEPAGDVSLRRLCLKLPGDAPANWTAETSPSPGIAQSEPADCAPPSTVIATGTQPPTVTRQTEPTLFSTFAGNAPKSVQIIYWIDNPERENEPRVTLVMNDNGTAGDIQADDQTWSVRLPKLPDNSIVRYKIAYQTNSRRRESPAPQRDAFPWHAYFVDPQSGTNLPHAGHLFLSAANWRALHRATAPGRVAGNQANPNWNKEVPAVFIATGSIHDVSVRHQGSRWNRNNGSTIPFQCASHQDNRAQVRSWRIDFPSYRNYSGMDTIILQKQSGWPQHISFKMFKLAGIPAPKTSWAKLRINGCDYNADAFLIERPGRDLVARWFSEVGDLFKSQGYTGNEGPWSWGDERLIGRHLNGYTQQERYEHTYNRKTLTWKNRPADGIPDAPQAMIEGLHQARKASPETLRRWLAEHFDIDRTLRYICTINYVGTFDDMFQNHYLYKKAEDGKWCLLPWDMDNTLGGAFGETTANPFRGVNETRHGNVGNRSGWWNRIKDSFFIAYEPEFLATFHQLNNTVHSPEALLPIVQEGAAARGLSQRSVETLMRHIRHRHNYLNRFIERRLPPPTLALKTTTEGILLEWDHRAGYALETAAEIDGHWSEMPAAGNRFLVHPDQQSAFFRLARRN